MKEETEQYFSRFSDEVREMIETVRTQSGENGAVSPEAAACLMEKAIELDSDILIGIAYYYYAESGQDAEDKDGTKIKLLGCINYLQGKGPYEYIAMSYYRLGQLEDSQDNPVMAVEYFENGLAVCEENGLWELKGCLLSGTGTCYLQMEQMQEAFDCYNRSLKQFRKIRREVVHGEDAVTALIGRAKCFLWLGRTKEAMVDKNRIFRCLKDIPKEKRPYGEACLFFAQCCYTEGDRETARMYIDRAGEQVEANCFAGRPECLREYLQTLIRMEEYDRLAGALQRLKPFTGRCRDRELQLYLFAAGINYTADRMSERELRSCVGEFFRLYDSSIKKRGESVARNLEVRRQLRQIQEKQQELKVLNRRLLSSSLHDALTGIPNRGYLNEHSEKIFERARGKGCSCGICLIDVDYFKQLNDRYGHMEGDRCLSAIGSLLLEKRNSRVFCARYGGDEFALVLYRMEREEIESLLLWIGKRIEELCIRNEDSEAADIVTLSIGCFYGIPAQEDKLWDFFGGADKALYEAKSGGKRRFVIREKSKGQSEGQPQGGPQSEA